MPIYEYRCPGGHVVERIRVYTARDEPVLCSRCQTPAARIMSAHHRQPDGIYSHTPNIGSADAHERKHAAMEERNCR